MSGSRSQQSKRSIRFQELQEIQKVPVFVGGRSIVNYQSVARTHGLIPLTGPILKSIEQLQAGYDLWCHQHSLGQ